MFFQSDCMYRVWENTVRIVSASSSIIDLLHEYQLDMREHSVSKSHKLQKSIYI